MEVDNFCLYDFNDKFIEVFESTESMRGCDIMQNKTKGNILNDLIHEDGDQMPSNDVLNDDIWYNWSFSYSSTFIHDQHPDISYAFEAKTSPNIYDKNDWTLTYAKKIKQE